LGLPKPRSGVGVGAGKIVIPGGRYPLRNKTAVDAQAEGAEAEEWRKNGTGRVDVRGFRELKI